MAGILAAVRRGCRRVAAGACCVRIAEEAVAAYAAGLPVEELRRPQMDPDCHLLGRGEQTLAFFVTLDSVNFGSGYFPEIFGPTRSGYGALAAALKARFEQSGPLSAAELSRLTLADTAGLFRLDPALPAAAELLRLQTRALNELGAFLQREHGGDFVRLVAAAGFSAERLVEELRRLPMFDDVAFWQRERVPFLKRAQLLAADLHIAFGGDGAGRFDDLDALTVMADNLVPHVLRWDGLLSYRQDLAARVDAGLPLPAGSPEEVEIRAAAVQAGELIVAALRRRGVAANALLLDNLLWHRGQEPRYRARPRHRTRTCCY